MSYVAIIPSYKQFDNYLRIGNIPREEVVNNTLVFSILHDKAKVIDRPIEGQERAIFFITSIRTDYSNEIVFFRDRYLSGKDNIKEFWNLNIQVEFPYGIPDFDSFIIFSARNYLNKVFDVPFNFWQENIQRTDLKPQGVFMYNENPVVYSHIILDSEFRKNSALKVSPQYEFRPISYLREKSLSDLDRILQKTLIEVKPKGE